MDFLHSLLLETPLPDDWDSNIFKTEIPFDVQLEYAKERAKEVGRGSSRVAFLILYEGRRTILKVALNHKGLAQNEAEADILSDPLVKRYGMFIPLIDYDDKNSQPTWIHTEYAKPVSSEAQIDKYYGVPYREIITTLLMSEEDENYEKFAFWRWEQDYGKQRTDHGKKMYERLYAICEKTELCAHDLNYTNEDSEEYFRQFGMYHGRPVFIDAGLTQTVYDSLYGGDGHLVSTQDFVSHPPFQKREYESI